MTDLKLRHILQIQVAIYYYFLQLIEDVMSLMDNLAVWDVESDGGWKEMARLGLNLLILYGQFPDVEVGGSTWVKSTDTVWSIF